MTPKHHIITLSAIIATFALVILLTPYLTTKSLPYGYFEHRGQIVDCRDGYTTDLCCELWGIK